MNKLKLQTPLIPNEAEIQKEYTEGVKKATVAHQKTQ